MSVKRQGVFIRLPDREIAKVRELAKAAGMPVSGFVKMLLLGAESSDAAPAKKAREAQIADIVGRLDGVEGVTEALVERIADLENAVATMAETLSEFVRVPSFIEWRARAKSENVAQKPGETDLQFLLRLAQAYYNKYRVWPDPSDPNKFGAFPSSAQPAQWPKSPPKG